MYVCIYMRVCVCVSNDAFTPGHMSSRNLYPEWAACIRIHICWPIHIAGRWIQVAVWDARTLYHGDIISIRLCHGRLVSLSIQQQTGDKLSTILLPIHDTCRQRQVDTTCIRQHVSWCKRGIRYHQWLNCLATGGRSLFLALSCTVRCFKFFSHIVGQRSIKRKIVND